MRDAFAKSLYERLFSWLVEKINVAMKTQCESQSAGKPLDRLLTTFGSSLSRSRRQFLWRFGGQRGLSGVGVRQRRRSRQLRSVSAKAACMCLLLLLRVCLTGLPGSCVLIRRLFGVVTDRRCGRATASEAARAQGYDHLIAWSSILVLIVCVIVLQRPPVAPVVPARPRPLAVRADPVSLCFRSSGCFCW